MKKQVLFVSAIALSLAFASCGGGEAKTEEKAAEEKVEDIADDAKKDVEEIKEEAAKDIEEVKKEAKKDIKKTADKSAAEVSKTVTTQTVSTSAKGKKANAKAVETAKQVEVETAPVTGGERRK